MPCNFGFVLGNALPKFGGVDVDVAAGVSLLELIIGDSAVVEKDFELFEITSEFARVVRIEFRGCRVTTSGHEGGGHSLSDVE